MNSIDLFIWQSIRWFIVERGSQRRLVQPPVGLGLGQSARMVQPEATGMCASSRVGRFASAHYPLKQIETRLVATWYRELIGL
jgi:hypothetical protein